MYQSLIKPFAADVKKFVLDTLFPIFCLSCGQEGAFICLDCKVRLTKLESQKCIACQKSAPFGLTHPGCLTPYSADGLISFYDYHDDKVSNILIKGKYSFLPEVYKILGAMAAEKIKTNFSHLLEAKSYTLIPVPLHSFRRRWRGFNQAEILCEAIGGRLGLPCISVLVRCKPTKTQKDLKKEQRLKNVTDSFALKKEADIHGQNLILVDDVTTTGATLAEAAKVLKCNGANKVICVTVAKD